MVEILPLLGVWLVAVVTPGPDFLVTVRYATARSRRHGAMVGLGVASGILLWATGSMLGLAVLFARLSWLYDIVRYLGAGYLVYLGVRTLWTNRRRGATNREATAREDPPANLPAGGAWRSWRVGFLTNLGNPKAAAFFGSLFGALLPAGTGAGPRAVVVLAMVGITVGWYTMVAMLFGLPQVAGVYRRARRWIDRVTAAVFIALGARLAIDR
jgi:threonine efflux protein